MVNGFPGIFYNTTIIMFRKAVSFLEVFQVGVADLENLFFYSAARVCGKKTPFHTWQKRQIRPFLLLFGHDQDKFDAPRFLHWGVSVALGNRHTP